MIRVIRIQFVLKKLFFQIKKTIHKLMLIEDKQISHFFSNFLITNYTN